LDALNFTNHGWNHQNIRDDYSPLASLPSVWFQPTKRTRKGCFFGQQSITLVCKGVLASPNGEQAVRFARGRTSRRIPQMADVMGGQLSNVASVIDCVPK